MNNTTFQTGSGPLTILDTITALTRDHVMDSTQRTFKWGNVIHYCYSLSLVSEWVVKKKLFNAISNISVSLPCMEMIEVQTLPWRTTP